MFALVIQYTSFRGLVALGFGGVGSARVAGFNSTDAARYSALSDAYDTPEALQVCAPFHDGIPHFICSQHASAVCAIWHAKENL